MQILARLLSKMLLMRLVIILFGLVVFVLTLDIISNADQILRIDPNMMTAMATYAAARSPEMIGQFLSISFLLAALLTLSDVSTHSELVAVWNAGISQLRVLLLFAPVTIAIGVAHFLVIDQLSPRAAPQLHEWAIGDYSRKKLSVSEDDPLWMRTGRDILRAKKTNKAATLLEDVIIFRRDAKGILLEQIMARQARLVQNRWVLEDVIIYYRSDQPPNRLKTLIYSAPMRPAASGIRSGDPREMSIAALGYFIKNAGFGIRPKYTYTTWWHKRISTVLVCALMILIAVPLAHRFKRGGGLGVLFMLGIACGFAYFIFDGIAVTMGELGLLPAWLAAWSPMVAFAAIAGTVAFRQETL